ncbi:MAG: hypothetical protein ABFS35_10660 [Bacteroidota bacterium]
MNIEKVKDALESVEYLLETEIQIIEYDELKNEYMEVLEKVEEAKAELS